MKTTISNKSTWIFLTIAGLAILAIFWLNSSPHSEALTEEQLKALLNEPGATVLDVRSADEYERGNVPGSINIPVDELSSRLDTLKKLNGSIVVVCLSGTRSASAINILREQGFTNVHNGGSWKDVKAIKN